jgi:hypothetical protein
LAACIASFLSALEQKGNDVMHRLRRLAVVLVAAGLVACAALTQPEAPALSDANAAECRARPDASQPQYIIGYGSLMQDESRKRTSPQAGPAHPVEVSGYRRGWFAKADAVGFSTTYLGAVPDPKSHLNAVIYRVDAGELSATDQREESYCRRSVPLSAIKTLERAPLQSWDGQAWIYANKPQSIGTPTARLPIVQSYVDIFVSGCLEQEQRFELPGFAVECLTTTHDWSTFWVNDRLHPRRPFIFQPRARQIDALLAQQLPQYFSQIRIE